MKKKELSLEQEIKAILNHYWFDAYAKTAYIENCTKKLVELFNKQNDQKN